MTSHFVRDQAGTTAVEFAFVLPTLIFVIVAILQLGITLQRWTALQAVSGATARCFAIATAPCSSLGDTKTFAIQTAVAWGLPSLTSDMVTVVSAQLAGLQTATVKIVYPVDIAGFTANLSASGTFLVP